MRIVFMGTPDFAVTILKKLVDEKKNIVGVITAPDRPAGRGQKLKKSAVKIYAESEGLKIMQPTNLKDEAFLEELSVLKADLQVVVAFRMLPEVVWNMPPKGTINLHASLLPQYRGAAPINWAIINGEEKTGVTTFFIEKEIDTGAVIEQESIAIETTDTAGTLHDKLMHLGATLTYQSVLKIESGAAQRVTQDEMGIDLKSLKPAPKIFKPDCQIDFMASTNDVINKIRGLSPYPTAWMRIVSKDDGTSKTCKLFFAIESEEKLAPSEMILKDGHIYIGTKDGSVEITEIQLEGKKRMPLSDLLRGFDFNNWKIQP